MRRGSIPEMTVRYRSSRPSFTSYLRISLASSADPAKARFSHLGRQIFLFFHFPCLNRIALATAIDDSAIAIEKKTPFDRMCRDIASQ